MAGVKSDKVQFVSSVEKCRNAEIFVDGAGSRPPAPCSGGCR